MGEFGTATDLYFGGDMEASIALTGQVAGRIDSVRPVAEIIAEADATSRYWVPCPSSICNAARALV